MAPSPTQIFDRALIRRRFFRARAAGAADFLARYAIADLGERLGVIRRDFASIADIATPTAEFARQLSARFRSARIVRLAPIFEPPAEAPAQTFVGDEEALPLAPETFDLAVSALALQHVNDLPGALIQIRRALKPDGLFLAALIGGDSLNELREVFAQAESEIEGGVSPRVAPFADLRELGALLQRAGFALPVVDSEKLTVRYQSVLSLMHDLRRMGATNNLHERRRRPLKRATLKRVSEVYAERFADADGRLRATFEIVWLSGWAPHESQQKPLKPGSAAQRLADALGAREIPAGEKAGR